MSDQFCNYHQHCNDNNQQTDEPNHMSYYGGDPCRPGPIKPRDNLQCSGGTDTIMQTEYRASYKGFYCHHPTQRKHNTNGKNDSNNFNRNESNESDSCPLDSDEQCQLENNNHLNNTADCQSDEWQTNANNSGSHSNIEMEQVIDESDNNKFKMDTVCVDQPYVDNRVCIPVSQGGTPPVPENNTLVCSINENRLSNRLCNCLHTSPYGCTCGLLGNRFPATTPCSEKLISETRADVLKRSDNNRLCFMPTNPPSKALCCCMNLQMEPKKLCHNGQLNVGPDWDYCEKRVRQENNICN